MRRRRKRRLRASSGSAPFVEETLIRATGNPIAPAWYMTGALIAGLTGVALIRERRPPPPGVPEGAEQALAVAP